ncbi:MAG: hypothetical protein WA208_17770 [Thermoanaerobaculia bacterium]
MSVYLLVAAMLFASTLWLLTSDALARLSNARFATVVAAILQSVNKAAVAGMVILTIWLCLSLVDALRRRG